MASFSWDTSEVTATKSGAWWTIDVTLCNLDEDTSIDDFVVFFDNTLQTNDDFTKTSATSLTYTGASIAPTIVKVRRNTPKDPYAFASYRTLLSSYDFNKNLERVARLTTEFYLYGASSSGDIDVSVSDEAYGAGWNGDAINAPSRNAVYDQFVAVQADVDDKLPLGGGTVTGTTTFSGSATFNGTTQVPDQVISDDSSKAANTKFVHDAIDGRIDNTAFDGTWNGDITDAPSKDVVYDIITTIDAEKADLAGATFTGAVVVPTLTAGTTFTCDAAADFNSTVQLDGAVTAGAVAIDLTAATVTAATQSSSDDSTRVATTAFVQGVVSSNSGVNEVASFRYVGEEVALNNTTWTVVPLNTEEVAQDWASVASSTITIDAATYPGTYEFTALCQAYNTNNVQFGCIMLLRIDDGTTEHYFYSSLGKYGANTNHVANLLLLPVEIDLTTETTVTIEVASSTNLSYIGYGGAAYSYTAVSPTPPGTDATTPKAQVSIRRKA